MLPTVRGNCEASRHEDKAKPLREACLTRKILLSAVVLGLAAWLCRPTAATEAAAQGPKGMVVTAQHEASAVGLAILKAGGNAIDAAVATGYALAVVDPCCGNIGGGGFMLIHTTGAAGHEGRDTFINFRLRLRTRA